MWGQLGAGGILDHFERMQTGNFEYYKDKEKTEKARRGRYFTVGDIGYADQAG